MAIARLGEIYLLKGDHQKAVEVFTEALNVLNENRVPVPKVLRLRGEAYLNLAGRQPSSRIAHAKSARRDLSVYIDYLAKHSSPPDATAYTFRGVSHALTGDLPVSLKDFDRALEIRDDLPEIWNNRGRCHLLMGNPEAALADYERGLKLCKEKGILVAPAGRQSAVTFLASIADVHRSLGNHSAARQAESEAQRIARENTTK